MLATKISKTEKAFLYLISIISGLLLLIYTPKQPSTGVFPQFSLIDQDSQSFVTEKTYSNKPKIIHFWASWCATCLPELVKYAEVQKLYADPLYVIAVNRRGNPSLSSVFIESLGIAGGMNYLVDTDDVLYRAVKGRKMPLTLFVDSHNKYSIIEGQSDKVEIEEHIKKMLLSQ